MFLEHQISIIRIISEGSCDSKDWRNDAEKSDLNHRNKLHFKMYSKKLFKIVKIFHNINVFTVCLMLWYINMAISCFYHHSLQGHIIIYILTVGTRFIFLLV